MSRTPHAIHWVGTWLFVGLTLFQAGCRNAPGERKIHPNELTEIGLPPPGSVPTELSMVNLPEYVIEPPDVLQINAVIRDFADAPKKIPLADEEQKKEDKPAEKDGPRRFADTVRSLPIQPVYGEYAVRPDGTIFLGVYGSVPVAGLTLKQAAAAIRSSLSKQVYADSGGAKEDLLLVVVDVTQYNSKSYTVIVDTGGGGERVSRWPITGKETVLDAISNVGGLSDESSKRNIWVARRTPFPNQPQQILPVDWVGTSQHGVTLTNYQLFPGDRVYIKAQRLVTIDRGLAKLISPVERIFGVTLLGASTVNQIQGRGSGFGNNNR